MILPAMACSSHATSRMTTMRIARVVASVASSSKPRK
jgi:hypothetical protein